MIDINSKEELMFYFKVSKKFYKNKLQHEDYISEYVSNVRGHFTYLRNGEILSFASSKPELVVRNSDFQIGYIKLSSEEEKNNGKYKFIKLDYASVEEIKSKGVTNVNSAEYYNLKLPKLSGRLVGKALLFIGFFYYLAAIIVFLIGIFTLQEDDPFRQYQILITIMITGSTFFIGLLIHALSFLLLNVIEINDKIS